MKGRANWPQAFAEVGLLLLGGALAFGIDGRATRAETRRYLVALEHDLEETRASFLFNLAEDERTAADCLALLEALDERPSAESDQRIRELVPLAFSNHYFLPSVGAYHDMVNSGDLRLPGDPLRIRLAEFESYFLANDRTTHEGARSWVDLQGPWLIENLDLKATLRRTGEWDLPGAADEPLDSWLRSQEFENLVIAKLMSLSDVVRNAREDLNRIDAILELIRQDLGQ